MKNTTFVVRAEAGGKYVKGKVIIGVDATFTKHETDAFVYATRDEARLAIEMLNVTLNIRFEVCTKFSNLTKEINDLCEL